MSLDEDLKQHDLGLDEIVSAKSIPPEMMEFLGMKGHGLLVCTSKGERVFRRTGVEDFLKIPGFMTLDRHQDFVLNADKPFYMEVTGNRPPHIPAHVPLVQALFVEPGGNGGISQTVDLIGYSLVQIQGMLQRRNIKTHLITS